MLAKEITFMYKLSKRGGSTKDSIIDILGSQWPLSARKIYFVLKKNQNISSGYQAVYKAIQEMVSEKIILKEKEGYVLNLDWVKDIHNKTELIRVNYYSKKQTVLFDSEDSEAIKVLMFKTWFDVEKYLYYLQKNYVSSSKDKEIICVHHSHEWRPLFYLRAEYNWMNQLNKLNHRVYILCSSNSEIDKTYADFYRKAGAKVKIGEKCAETCEIMCFGDLVIQIYLPENLRTKLDSLFSRAKNSDELDKLTLIKDVFEKESEIKVMIYRDKNLAKQIREQTLKKFR